MDNPGQSLFLGGSIHIDSIRPPDPDDDEEEEEEEENRQREAEIQGMLANAFDDLEEDESFVNMSSHYSLVSNRTRQTSNNEEPHPPRDRHPEGYSSEYSENVVGREFNPMGNYEADNPSVLSHEERMHHSHSDSQTPWSDESDDNSNRFSPLDYHETVGDHHFTDQEGLSGNLQHSLCLPNNTSSRSVDGEMPLEFVGQDPYLAEKYKSSMVLDGGNQGSNSADYHAADTPYEQLKHLYEARGRELDKLVAELSKVKSESMRETRVLQHQLNLVTSENESRKSNLNHLQILLSEKDEMVKNLRCEVTEMQRKNRTIEDENKKLKFELETAESTISSLECQISELKAADSLARNQQLHKDFVSKLRHGNQEEKDMLIKKLQDLQQESESYQQEVRKLREDLKTLRKTHDDLLVQKTETATKLSVTVQTLQNQYEDLLQSHGSHKILELQVRNKTLEADKERLEKNIKSLEDELEDAKEEIKGFDSALMFGIFSEAAPVEDSMVQMGIKRALNYNDTTVGESNKITQEPLTGVQMMKKMREEVKRSLMANKAKRDEITRLQEDSREKQNLLRKIQSDLKSSQVEVKELKENVFKLKLEQAESQAHVNMKTKEKVSTVRSVLAENISLKQELTHLHGSLRNMKQTAQDFSLLINDVKKSSSKNPSDGTCDLVVCYNKLLQTAENNSKCISDIEKYQELISHLREENQKMREESGVWEKRLHDIEVKLVVVLQMVKTAISDRNNANEYTHAQNVLKKLIEDVEQQIKIIKESAFAVEEKNIDLRGQLATLELQFEKQSQKVSDLIKENESLQMDMLLIAKKKDEEKSSALQSCQDTYLRFHEDAVKELETKFNAEYENIGGKLKHEISRLAEELSNVKTLYVNVCEEKNEMEKRLKDSKEVVTTSSRSGSRGENQRNVVLGSSVDSGTGLDSSPSIRLYEEKVQTLQRELTNVRSICQGENKMLVAEKEKLEGQYQREMETKIKEVQEEMLRSVEEFQKKCTTLEECNHILKDKISSLEGGSSRSGLNTSTIHEEAMAAELEKCQRILQTQRQQFQIEKKELQAQFETELGDIKERLSTANKMRAEETEAAYSYKNTLQEQEKQIKSLRDELSKVKERMELRELESEQEVQRVTDMVLNLESDVREKEEELSRCKAAYQRRLEDLNNDQCVLKQRLKAAGEDTERLKEISSKYNTLKIKFIKYHEASDEQRTSFKMEINRLEGEFVTAKETLIKRVQDYVEALKKKCVLCIESTINALKDFESIDPGLHQLRLKMDVLNSEIKNFSLKLS